MEYLTAFFDFLPRSNKKWIIFGMYEYFNTKKKKDLEWKSEIFVDPEINPWAVWGKGQRQMLCLG